MSTKFVKAAAIAVASTFAFTAAMASAQDEKPRSLDQLLEFVKQGQVTEAKESRAREQAFANDKANQAAELQRANDCVAGHTCLYSAGAAIRCGLMCDPERDTDPTCDCTEFFDRPLDFGVCR